VRQHRFGTRQTTAEIPAESFETGESSREAANLFCLLIIAGVPVFAVLSGLKENSLRTTVLHAALGWAGYKAGKRLD
jgi:hypothetical protein